MKSIGERRVRVEFNPSNNDLVNRIKTNGAKMINELEKLIGSNGENNRTIRIAQTKTEEATMWAVKAATYKPAEKIEASSGT